MVLSVKRVAGACSFLALLLLFSASPASAMEDIRSGKIITTQADTLRGDLIKTDSYSQSWRIQFREEGNSTFRTYRPFDIYAYYIGDAEAWFSVQGEFEGEGSQNVFMREEATGRVKLYSTHLTRERVVFFARSQDDRLVYLWEEFYLEQLERLFGNCGQFLMDERHPQRRYRYNMDGMLSAFSAYYECLGDPVAEFEGRITEQTRSIRFGVHGGLNTSNSRITDEISLYQDVFFEYQTGFTVGLFVDFPLTEHIFLTPEMFYSTRGGFASVRVADPPGAEFTIVSDDEISATFNYIGLNIPVRREWQLAGTRPYVAGGPAIGYLVKREASLQREVIIIEDDERVTVEGDVIQFYKDLAIGLNVAAGIRVPLGNYSLFFSSRYSRLFSNLDSQTPSFRTTSLELIGGFSF